MKKIYKLVKASAVGTICICPSCGKSFEKKNYQQTFCKTFAGTICKDKYWNTVDPKKRNNTTRISPASKLYTQFRIQRREDFDDTHPFSEDAFMH